LAQRDAVRTQTDVRGNRCRQPLCNNADSVFGILVWLNEMRSPVTLKRDAFEHGGLHVRTDAEREDSLKPATPRGQFGQPLWIPLANSGRAVRKEQHERQSSAVRITRQRAVECAFDVR
jgi:hypothetical protein